MTSGTIKVAVDLLQSERSRLRRIKAVARNKILKWCKQSYSHVFGRSTFKRKNPIFYNIVVQIIIMFFFLLREAMFWTEIFDLGIFLYSLLKGVIEKSIEMVWASGMNG